MKPRRYNPSSVPPARKRHKKMHLNLAVEDGDSSGLRFRVPPSQAQPKAVFTSCHNCGYDPGVIPESGACPKCGGYSWERNAISIRLLPKGSRR